MANTRIDLCAELQRYQALRLGKIDAARRSELDHEIAQLRKRIAELDRQAREAPALRAAQAAGDRRDT